MVAEPGNGEVRLHGSKSYVLDGNTADLVVVAARRVARLDLDGVRGQTLEGGRWPALASTLNRLKVALSAEMIGGAQRCLERAVKYAKQRHQFGRPIGSFQAIKHRGADILLEVESARSAVYYAAWAAGENNGELPAVAPLAKACASQAYWFAASESLHVHGGIGFTWEAHSHLYFKRAKASELLYGDASANKEVLATRLGLGLGSDGTARLPGLVPGQPVHPVRSDRVAVESPNLASSAPTRWYRVAAIRGRASMT